MYRTIAFILFFLLFVMCDKTTTGGNEVEVTYLVEYGGNGHTSGTTPEDAKEYKTGDSAIVKSPISMVKIGHRFTGWNTKLNGSGTAYAPGSKLVIGKSDVMLYAQWIQQSTLTPPNNCTATAGNQQNSITFSPVMGATKYYLYWGTTVPVTKSFPKIELNSNNFTHSGLTNGTTYFYAIASVDNNGESILSTEFNATPNGGSVVDGMVLISAKGKSFLMGNSSGDTNEKPVHRVSFTYDFYMSTTEVTQSSYETLMGVNPSHFKGTNLPVESCNWYDAVLYCNARSKKEGKDTVYTYTAISGTAGNKCSLTGLAIDLTKNGYRLPTEAEWEYACRGGTTTIYYWGNTMNGDYCWYLDNANYITHTVKTKKPNPYGLYDMNGNVWEFCNDWYGDYTSMSVTDPIGNPNGVLRVFRGGGWTNSDAKCNSSNRDRTLPGQSSRNIGFRFVRSQK